MLCAGRRRRMSTQTTSKSGSLGVCRSQSVPRDYDSYIRRAGRQSLNTDISTMRRCDCLFHSQDSFSSTMLNSRKTDQYAPHELPYAHASSTQLSFPPEVISVSGRKRFQEAAILSADVSSSSVDSCVDVTLDQSRDRCQPDIVT